MSGFLPWPDQHKGFSSGIPFLSQTSSFRWAYCKSVGQDSLFQAMSSLFWGFHVSMPILRTTQGAPRGPRWAAILDWVDTKHKAGRAVRSSARAHGTLMCTFKRKCWDHLFSDHHQGADDQDGGKEASSWDLLCIHPGPWLLSTKGQAKHVVQRPTGPVQRGWLWNDPASVELSSGSHFPFSCPVINSIAWLPGRWPWRAQLSMLLSPREHCEHKQST